MNFLRQLWLSIRSNPVFVAAEGGATGAVINYASEQLVTGHMDFSKAGWEKMAGLAVTGAVTAVRLLYRPSPGTSPTK
jgi:hypothetical protein